VLRAPPAEDHRDSHRRGHEVTLPIGSAVRGSTVSRSRRGARWAHSGAGSCGGSLLNGKASFCPLSRHSPDPCQVAIRVVVDRLPKAILFYWTWHPRRALSVRSYGRLPADMSFRNAGRRSRRCGSRPEGHSGCPGLRYFGRWVWRRAEVVMDYRQWTSISDVMIDARRSRAVFRRHPGAAGHPTDRQAR
jgi:hypothetical protein